MENLIVLRHSSKNNREIFADHVGKTLHIIQGSEYINGSLVYRGWDTEFDAPIYQHTNANTYLLWQGSSSHRGLPKLIDYQNNVVFSIEETRFFVQEDYNGEVKPIQVITNLNEYNYGKTHLVYFLHENSQSATPLAKLELLEFTREGKMRMNYTVLDETAPSPKDVFTGLKPILNHTFVLKDGKGEILHQPNDISPCDFEMEPFLEDYSRNIPKVSVKLELTKPQLRKLNAKVGDIFIMRRDVMDIKERYPVALIVDYIREYDGLPIFKKVALQNVELSPDWSTGYALYKNRNKLFELDDVKIQTPLKQDSDKVWTGDAWITPDSEPDFDILIDISQSLRDNTPYLKGMTIGDTFHIHSGKEGSVAKIKLIKYDENSGYPVFKYKKTRKDKTVYIRDIFAGGHPDYDVKYSIVSHHNGLRNTVLKPHVVFTLNAELYNNTPTEPPWLYCLNTTAETITKENIPTLDIEGIKSITCDNPTNSNQYVTVKITNENLKKSAFMKTLKKGDALFLNHTMSDTTYAILHIETPLSDDDHIQFLWEDCQDGAPRIEDVFKNDREPTFYPIRNSENEFVCTPRELKVVSRKSLNENNNPQPVFYDGRDATKKEHKPITIKVEPDGDFTNCTQSKIGESIDKEILLRDAKSKVGFTQWDSSDNTQNDKTTYIVLYLPLANFDELKNGDVIFFRNKAGKIYQVGEFLGQSNHKNHYRFIFFGSSLSKILDILSSRAYTLEKFDNDGGLRYSTALGEFVNIVEPSSIIADEIQLLESRPQVIS